MNKIKLISSVLYRLTFELHKRITYHSKWLCFIKTILNSCRSSHDWLAQYVPENCNLARMVKV